MSLNLSETTAIDALRDELSRRIDSQTHTLAPRLNTICTFLSVLVATILFGFVFLAAVLYEALNR